MLLERPANNGKKRQWFRSAPTQLNSRTSSFGHNRKFNVAFSAAPRKRSMAIA
ncbi:hypothetical protein [Bradyrhizobium embrapense]